MTTTKLYFDEQDFTLLKNVNKTIEEHHNQKHYSSPIFHPSGIVDLIVSKEMRMASAVLNLLDTLETKNVQNRLQALRNLKEEVLVTAKTKFRRNTARILIVIMKEIVRMHGNEEKQLQLIHDFRMAAKGKMSFVRKLLKKYYLLEMPEEWNQLVFDHHVHDANTKGRKNPTHLIMDAWIKGIRSLSVIYYSHVTAEASTELIEAARIMDINIEIGILFNTTYNNKLIDFIWAPKGNNDFKSFVDFINASKTQELFKQGIEVNSWKSQYILNILKEWNEVLRPKLSQDLDMELPPTEESAFHTYVGIGQYSITQMAELIHQDVFPLLEEKAEEIKEKIKYEDKNSDAYSNYSAKLATLNKITIEYFNELLTPLDSKQQKQMILDIKNQELEQSIPPLMKLSPYELIDSIMEVSSNNNIVLNLAELSCEEILTLIWDCKGKISHLELFNMHDWANGKLTQTKEISELLDSINAESSPRLKQMILDMLYECNEKIQCFEKEKSRFDYKEKNTQDFNFNCEKDAETRDKLLIILENIPQLIQYYKYSKLRTRVGTDSTSRMGRFAGMGLAYAETLPSHALSELKNTNNDSRLRLPIRKELKENFIYRMPYAKENVSTLVKAVRRIPFIKRLSYSKEKEWKEINNNISVFNDGMCSHNTKDFPTNQGNIITLGGVGKSSQNNFIPPEKSTKKSWSTQYINNNILNLAKILIGFIPAFFCFHYTQEHGFLAWFGAIIWFAVTGFRNIIQAVLGGGGLKRSHLMHWNNYVSKSRICDSLMYTGLSVVLLELIVRNIILEKSLGITAINSPTLVFTTIAITNGIYIVFHNYIRGLQVEAMVGNFFRSFFSIPLSLVYNGIFALVLANLDPATAATLLLSSSAIISKLASDTVAAVIEGLADKKSNIWLRQWDYNLAVKNFYSNYNQLELYFTNTACLEMLESPQPVVDYLKKFNPDFLQKLTISSLDMMYIFYYQPRAVSALKNVLQNFSHTERLSWYRMQQILLCQKDVSQFFIDNSANNNFAPALSFYLTTYERYLKELETLCLSETN